MKRWAKATIQLLVVVLLGAMVAGAVLGQPVLFSFVETGSMEPELEPGDGFIAIPTELSSDITEDDVIVFEAEEIEGGGLTTHRVVDHTDRGYVTRGDANPFTDQDGGEPPVQEPQIVATALQIDGSIVRIPWFGTAVLSVQSTLDSVQRWAAVTFGTQAVFGMQGVALLFFVVSALVLGLDVVRERSSSTSDRARDAGQSRTRSTGVQYRWFVAGCALLLMIAASAAMLLPAGTTEFGIVSAEFSSDSTNTIEQGTTESVPHGVENGGILPVVTYFDAETEGMRTSPERIDLSARSVSETTVHIDAPEETGFYRYYITEHRYLAILPSSTIDWLYDHHHFIPFAVINVIIGSSAYFIGRLLAPGGRMRGTRSSRSPSRQQ